jgi:hypothetical protein
MEKAMVEDDIAVGNIDLQARERKRIKGKERRKRKEKR